MFRCTRSVFRETISIIYLISIGTKNPNREPIHLLWSVAALIQTRKLFHDHKSTSMSQAATMRMIDWVISTEQKRRGYPKLDITIIIFLGLSLTSKPLCPFCAVGIVYYWAVCVAIIPGQQLHE